MARSVLITGGTGAIGSAVTRRFLEDGHRVAVTWIVQEERDELVADVGPLGERLFELRADVTDADEVAAAVGAIEDRNGPVDALVHLVGGWRGDAAVHEDSVETWERLFGLNVVSAAVCAGATLPGMLERGWGRIALVSARAARQERAGQAAYAVAKAGVGVLAEAIAEETRGTGVTANAVAPSVVDTPANRRSMPDADPSAWVPPSDLAAILAFLCSEEAGQLRGGWLPVYGSA